MSRLHFGLSIERQGEAWILSRPGASRRVLARNYRCRGGELDLVLEERRPDGAWELVFVEIRYRGEGAWIPAAESVDGLKRLRLSRAIRRYLQSYRGEAETVRVDVLARGPGGWEHLTDIRIDG